MPLIAALNLPKGFEKSSKQVKYYWYFLINHSKQLTDYMDDINLKLNDKGHGAFYVIEENEQLGEMVVSIDDANLTVYHTEVSPKAEGKGYAKKMLSAMVEYARSNQLKVIPLCPYVHAQFKRHPKEYADVWNQEQQKG